MQGESSIAVVSPYPSLYERGLKRRRSEQPGQIASCGSDVSDVCVAAQCERDFKRYSKQEEVDIEVSSALVSLKHSKPKRAKTEKSSLRLQCAEFIAELKLVHPPGSPVFTVFQAFLLSQRADIYDLERIILEISQLLKATPPLLRKFYALLPRWCFKTHEQPSYKHEPL